MAVAAGIAASSPAADVLSVAHPEEDFDAARTVVWTPLFQVAWDRLNADLGGKPVKVEPPNPLMEKLDSFKWQSAEVMPKGHWKVWSGEATPDFVAKANREAMQWTGEPKGPFSELPERTSIEPGRLVLGLLDRELKFTKMLHPSTSMPLAFRSAEKEHPVRFFGVRGDRSAGHRAQVRILSRTEGSHALQIAAADDESLVLYLPKERESFAAACTKLQAWRKEKLTGEYGSAMDPGLHAKDDLRIPYVTLTASADFTPSLPSLRFYEGHRYPWRISKAEQRTKFEMTEKGAKVRAEVELKADPLGDPPPPPPITPRNFHFDRPFYVFMWRDGAEWPYFGAWIGDQSAMEIWK
jgi:hypothetical protein